MINSNDLYREYVDNKISLTQIPINKITWKILGMAAIKETDIYIKFIFDMCENKNINIDLIRLVDLLPKQHLSQDIYDRVFKINPKKYFLSIPKKFRTEQMIIEYNSLTNFLVSNKISPRERKQDMYNSLYKENPIKNFALIPDEYKTQGMCNDFFHIDPLNHFKMIPSRFITREMCIEFLKLNPFKHFQLIPDRFKTIEFFQNNILQENNSISKQAVYNEMFRRNPIVNFIHIPEEYRTQEMYERIAYLSKDITILDNIPSKFRNKRIYEILFWKNPKKFFTLVPDKFKTREMCDIVLKIDFDSFFSTIPDEYKTQEECNRFFDIDPLKNIWKIPLNFRTKDMLLKIIDLDDNLFGIIKFPKNVMTKETYKMVFDKIDSFKAFELIPEQYISQEMCDRLFNIDYISAFKIIPDRYITKRMCIYVLDNLTSISEMGLFVKRFKNQEIFDYMFDKNYKKYFKYIPSEFRNKRMYLHLLKNNVYKYSKIVPMELYDDIDVIDIVCSELKKIIDKNITIPADSELCLNVIKLYPSLIKVLEQQYMDNIIIGDIYSIINEHGTLEFIANKYDVSIYYIENLVEKIKNIDIDKYNIIKKILEDNRINYLANMLNDITNLGEIILSLGDIVNYELNAEQKIKFAYLFYKFCNNSLEEIYYFDYKKYSYEYLNDINFFFNKCLKYKYIFTSTDYAEEKNIFEFNNSWLKKYNRNSFFKIKEGIPSIEHKYGKEGKLLTFDIEIDIISRLKNECIPLNSYIVQCSFKEYFNNNLDGFIAVIKSYDCLMKNSKKRIRKI